MAWFILIAYGKTNRKLKNNTMKRIIGILAILALANPLFAQTDSITRPVQNMSGDGTQGLYGTPDYLSEHPNDTIRSNNGMRNQPVSQTQNTTYPPSQTPISTNNTAGGVMNTDGDFASENPGTNINNNPFYTFDNTREPKEISKLGTNPEFTFLAHLSTSGQVYKAMKSHKDNSTLNNIIMGLGFTNGIQDLQASNITPATIPGGTTGNMGSGSGTTGYYKLIGDNGFKAWKVTGNDGQYIFFLQACGNEFYPQTGKPEGTACINAPINVVADPVTITANGRQNQVTDKVFVYYHVKRAKHGYANPEITDANPSKPLLLSTKTREELIPETYNVTLSAQTQNEMVCPDSAVNVAANINVEKSSSYTGNYPDKTNNTYKLVTKREYMRAERKMRKAERKEEKVARLTKTPVDTAEMPANKNS